MATLHHKSPTRHETINLLFSILVLDAKPVVDAFLTYTFMVQPAGEAGTACYTIWLYRT